MSLPSELAVGREAFLELVADVRVDLHRYCARLTGSVIEGEDIVQETFAKALYALSMSTAMPELRPWLFRIAHNTAIDSLRRHERKHVEVRGDFDDVVAAADEVDPFATRVALSRFLALPLVQRSAVILKDVLGHSLEETAEEMGTTVPAVKAALVRGRARLRETTTDAAPPSTGPTTARSTLTNETSDEGPELERYAALFNARDWDGVKRLIAQDCRLDLVSKAARRGKEVGQYFGRYVKENVRLRVVRLEGKDVLAAYEGAPGASAVELASPSYFILLEWTDGQVTSIRDFRYARHVAKEAELG